MTDSPTDTPTPPTRTGAHALLTGLAMRAGQTVLGRVGGRAAPDDDPSAKAAQTLAALAIARVGTRSLPGAALVSAGLIAKALYDRRQKRRAAPRAADQPKA